MRLKWRNVIRAVCNECGTNCIFALGGVVGVTIVFICHLSDYVRATASYICICCIRLRLGIILAIHPTNYVIVWVVSTFEIIIVWALNFNWYISSPHYMLSDPFHFSLFSPVIVILIMMSGATSFWWLSVSDINSLISQPKFYVRRDLLVKSSRATPIN